MAPRIELTINGRKVSAEADASILQTALANGIYIPHLCHHKDLTPSGVCRLCLVEVNGTWTTISCKTPVAAGMSVRTETPAIQSVRKVTVELLLADHQTDCLACGADTDCGLQRVAHHVGVDATRLARLRKRAAPLPLDESNPFFTFDPNRCVLCGICVRTCEQIERVSAIDYAFRGPATKIAGFGDKGRIDSACESCGECLVRCPVGALTAKDALPPTQETKTVCTFCGCGCGLYLGTRDGKLVRARGDETSPANRGRLCVKGRFGYRFVNHPDRLKAPLVRKDGVLVETTWDEALDLVAGKFSERRGDAFGAISSAKCTNEENYLFQKFTRAVMGTNNLDHCARL